MITTPIVDSAVMAASLLFAVGFAYQASKRRRVSLGLLAGLSLGPSTAFIHMWAHMFAVLIVNAVRFQKGVFHYDLRFYALLQMGAVLLLLSGLSLYLLGRWAAGAYAVRRPLIWLALLQMIFSFPLFPFTPIGILPGLSAVLFLVTLAFTRRQFQQEQQVTEEYALA